MHKYHVLLCGISSKVFSLYVSDIATATNIVFSNGDLDPWRGGGVSAPTFSHLLDLNISCKYMYA